MPYAMSVILSRAIPEICLLYTSKFYMRTLINVSREIIDSATTEEAEA